MQLKVVDFTEWLGNGRPPWAAYHALISGRLIALDKQTGVKPVRVLETWRRLMSKFILRVIGQEGKAACGMGQLAGEFEAGIEGGGPCYAPSIGTTLPGGGLWVPPH